MSDYLIHHYPSKFSKKTSFNSIQTSNSNANFNIPEIDEFDLPDYEPAAKKSRVLNGEVPDVVDFIDNNVLSENLKHISDNYDNAPASTATLEGDFKHVTSELRTKNPLLDVKLIEDLLLCKEDTFLKDNVQLGLLAKRRKFDGDNKTEDGIIIEDDTV